MDSGWAYQPRFKEGDLWSHRPHIIIRLCWNIKIHTPPPLFIFWLVFFVARHLVLLEHIWALHMSVLRFFKVPKLRFYPFWNPLRRPLPSTLGSLAVSMLCWKTWNLRAINKIMVANPSRTQYNHYAHKCEGIVETRPMMAKADTQKSKLFQC